MTKHTDKTLVSRIQGLLDECPEIDPLFIEVVVVDGIAGLKGEVGSFAEKLAVAELAAGVVGAGNVRNEIVPRPYATDWKLSDEEIADDIRNRLNILYKPSGSVDVEVDHHVVTLRGRVSSTAERAIVRHMVELTNGVNIVHNEIAV